MTEPTTVTAGAAGLIKTILSTVTKARTDKAEISSIRKLVDRKFGEIEATHKLFIDLLHRLEKASQGAKTRVSSGKSVSRATSALMKVVGSIEATRKKKLVERMKEYQEAAVFERAGFVEQGIIKKIPDDVVQQLLSFMRAFAGYFTAVEIDQHYHHSLRASLDSAYMAIHLIEAQTKRSDARIADAKQSAETAFDSLMNDTRKWAEFSARQWAEIAAEYHKLNLLLRQHGYV